MWYNNVGPISVVLSQFTCLTDGRTVGRFAPGYTVRCITCSRTVKTDTDILMSSSDNWVREGFAFSDIKECSDRLYTISYYFTSCHTWSHNILEVVINGGGR